VNGRPKWWPYENGMFLELPFSEKNADFLKEMRSTVPAGSRKWEPTRKEWWVERGFVLQVDRLINRHFGHGGAGVVLLPKE